MKKILLIASTIFIGSLQMISQSSVIVNDFSNGQLPIANNSVLNITTTSYEHITTEINVKNTTSSAKVYKLRRFDQLLNSGASAYFCVSSANCYAPATTVTPISVTLAANGTSGDDLYSQNLMFLLDLEEGLTPGVSHVRYEIFNVSDANDVFAFTINYNDFVSVKENTQSFSSLSGVYPNPALSKAFINITSTEFVNDATVTITNSLGSIVSSKKIDISAGKNIVALESENLTSGIYFATISANKTRVIKKFTVNK